MAFGSLSIYASAIILFQITFAELLVKPTDTEALVGYPTYFNCSTSVVSQEIHWFHHPFVANGGNSFVYGYNQFYNQYKDRFAMEKNEATGTFNLIIRSVQVEDAGRYECQEDVGRGTKASARLIVLDQNPICQSNQKTNELVGPNACGIPLGEVQLSCSTTYHGDDAPLLRWFKDDSDQPLDGAISVSPSGNRSFSNLTLKADMLNMNGSSFHCRTTRSKPTQYSCTSDTYKIIGINTTSPVCPLCSDTTAAFLVIFLFLIPLIIAASVIGGAYLPWRWRWPWPFKIFYRLGLERKEIERRPNPVDLHVVEKHEEDVPLKPPVAEIIEPEVFPDNYANTIEELSKQYEEVLKQKRQSEASNKRKEKELADLKQKYKQLEDDKRELEGWLYPPATTTYSDNPRTVVTIDIQDPKTNSKKKKKPIFGMTILLDKLYVVTESSSAIEVYDSVTFNREINWEIADMSNPMDIASCSSKKCLYICDSKSKNELTILKVDSSQKILNKWTIEEEGGHLSVTREANVILSLFNGKKIIEYSSDGDVIRTVRLSPADNVNHPWHAIKTTSMHFIFSHGIGDDPLHRICVANADGKILKSFGGRKGDIKEKQMNRPVHLLEDGSRNVLVADMKNKRVLLLSPTLEYKRILVSADKHKLRFPIRLCLDEERGILFVADNNYTEKSGTYKYDGGRIFIFNCKT